MNNINFNNNVRNPPIWKRAILMLKDKGSSHVVSTVAYDLFLLPSYLYHQINPGSFQLNGKKYIYCNTYYNRSWSNERAVEIPIICDFMRNYQKKRILEVGNVLSHYFVINHDVIDKYEIAQGIINCDIVDFNQDQIYDLIICISTLEHIGYDEHPQNSRKVIIALDNMKKMLTERGKLIVTVPIGYNPKLDEYIKRNELGFTSNICMKRISAKNEWVECSWKEIEMAKYGYPFPACNGLFIGIFIK